eukprot:scaffold3792_cov160-Skeletonema_menzelii.AAC.13
MSGLINEKRADDEASPALPASSNGEVDLLDSAEAEETKLETEEATDVDNEGDEFRDKSKDLSHGENGNSLADDPPNIASVTALVNEIRGLDNTESPLISQKIEAMEQGSRYRDDPNSNDSSLPYYSSSYPPAGIWSSSQTPQLRSVSRYNTIGSFIRSKIFTYFAIVAILIGIAVAIAAAVTKGFEHIQHRNHLLHPKWDNDEVTQDPQVVDGETVVWMKNSDNSEEDEGSIMQDVDVSSLPTEVYTDKQESLDYQLANTYIPIWFSRETGWNGSTHAEAVEFCKSRDDTSLVFATCPYDVYCPGGKKILIFDEEVEEADSWAPVLEANKWVQVGSGGRVCDSVVMDDLGEKLTRHIMCCLETPIELSGSGATAGGGVQAPPNVNDEGGDSNVDDPLPPPPMANNDVEGGSAGVTLPTLLQTIVDKYHPRWSEWLGTTYEEAKQFCGDQNSHLCPLDVYCPFGPIDNKPLFYEMDAFQDEQWAPVGDFNERWVVIGNAAQQTCVLNPLELSVDVLSPTVKKHIMCCQAPTESSTDVSEIGPEHFEYEGGAFKEMNPVWYGTDEWISGSHDDAQHFCNFKGKSLCPYTAYCPDGPGKHPIGGWVGSKDFEEQWAPVLNPNQWVLIGAENDNPFSQCKVTDSPSFGFDTSQPELKLHIMCCDKEQSDTNVLEVGTFISESSSAAIPEENLEHFDFEGSVSNELNPVWYGTDEWTSGSHGDALQFCNTKGKSLCPYAAYCPYGPGKHPVDGWVGSEEFEEQWAPVSNPNQWVLIGAENDSPLSQCKVTDSPSFGFDNSQPELKLHIMCCDEEQSDASALQVGTSTSEVNTAMPEQGSDSSLLPVWYSSNDGWDGGSHETALLFCLGKKKTLCPVEIYCPNGPSRPPFKGYGGSAEIEQWAPASDKENYWVMIGLYDMDETTQCLDQDDILGGYPSWGLDESYSEHKRHIMCCSGSSTR